MNRLFKILSVVFGIICMSALCMTAAGCFLLPDDYTILENTTLDLGKVYLIHDENRAVISNRLTKENKGQYEADISLLGIIPVKSVNVSVEARRQLIVCGSIMGLRLYSDGVSVIDTDSVTTDDGLRQPAFEAGFMKGDAIVSVNGVAVYSSADISYFVEACNGNALQFQVKRGVELVNIDVYPVKDHATGVYRVGLWLRDSAAGIGTMTFFDPQTNAFASLGHSVCDVQTGLEVALRKGDILTASINAVTKGSSGVAGEIAGSFADRLLGDIYENGNQGVYGILSDRPVAYGIFPLAEPEEVVPGAAEVITSIDNNGPKSYSAEIVSVDHSVNGNKNMVIKITDAALLAATGGIIQGM